MTDHSAQAHRKFRLARAFGRYAPNPHRSHQRPGTGRPERRDPLKPTGNPDSIRPNRSSRK